MKKIFVNGTFDLLHEGHIALINYAKTLGDELSTLLINLKSVNDVYIFDTDEELEYLVSIHDVMVKGSDYKDKPIIGQDVCKELVFFDRIDGYSTTQKIQDITDR